MKINKHSFQEIHNHKPQKLYAYTLKKLHYRNPDYLSYYREVIDVFQKSVPARPP